MSLDALVLRINHGLYLAAAVWMFGLALLIFADVTGRGLLNQPVPGVAEIVANSVVSIAFLQLCQSIRMGGMLRAEIIDAFLPAGGRRALAIVGDILGAVLFAAIAYSSWEPMVDAWRIQEYAGGEGSLRVPVYPVRTILVAMSVFASVNFLLMLWQTVRQPMAHEPAAHNLSNQADARS